MYILELDQLKPVFKEYELLLDYTIAYDIKEDILKLCKEIRKEINDNKDNEFVIDKYELYNIYDNTSILKEKLNKNYKLYKISKKRLLQEIENVEYKYSLLDIDKEINEELLEDGIEVRFKIEDTTVTIGYQLSTLECNTISIAKNLNDRLSISIGYVDDILDFNSNLFSFTIPDNKKAKFKLISNPDIHEKYIEVTIIGAE